MSQLQYETFLVRREGLTRDLPAGHPRPRRSRLRHRAAAGGLPRRSRRGDGRNHRGGPRPGQRRVPRRILGQAVPGQIPAAGATGRTARRHHPSRGPRPARHRGRAHRHHGNDGALVPSLRLIVAGDVVYNNTHMYLAESTTASRREWNHRPPPRKSCTKRSCESTLAAPTPDPCGAPPSSSRPDKGRLLRDLRPCPCALAR